MPKVSIREIDNTGGETLEYLNYTVLIPGPKLGKAKAGSTTEYEAFEPAEPLTSVKELADLEALDEHNAKVNTNFKADLGFLMMTELLAKGVSVFYVPAYILSESTADDVPVISAALADFDLNEQKDGFAKFSDRGRYDLRFITLGGLFNVEDKDRSYSKQALNCAGNRGDAVALLDIPEKGSNQIMFYESKTTANSFIFISEYNSLSTEAKKDYEPRYGFEVYIKENPDGSLEYSSEPETDYERAILDLKQYNRLSDDNQAIALLGKQTTNAEIELKTSDEMNDWVQEIFATYCNQTITRKGVS